MIEWSVLDFEGRCENCIASQAVGATLDVTKNAHLYSVMMDVTNDASIHDAFVNCVNNAISLGLRGRVVINMSFGGPALLPQYPDCYPAFLNWAVANGIVVVAAAGNDGDNEGFPTDPSNLVDSMRPGRYGVSIPGFLTVGGVDVDGFRSPLTPKCSIADVGTAYCLQAYALGTNVRCAVLNKNYVIKTGTSFAAPQVAGLVAYLLSYPNADVQHIAQGGGIGSIAANIERLIEDMSYRRYTDPLSDTESPNVPDVIFNSAVVNLSRVAPVPILQ